MTKYILRFVMLVETRRRIVIITGPTAVGKTALAVKVAKQFPVRLISVDSGQVYRGLDLGTAKPSQALLDEFPHDLVNVRDMCDVFSVVDFCSAAARAINESLESGVLPVLVGPRTAVIRPWACVCFMLVKDGF